MNCFIKDRDVVNMPFYYKNHWSILCEKQLFCFLSLLIMLSCATTEKPEPVAMPSTGCIEGNCENGIGTFRWVEGDSYTGNWINGKRNMGTYKWQNGDSVTGNWTNGKLNGTGTFKWQNGESYTGNWVNNSREGYGVHIFANGDKFEGKFFKNVPEGNGKYTYADGTVEEGMFSNYIFTGEILLPKAGDDEKVQVSKVVEVNPSAFEVTVTDAGGLKLDDKLFVEINGIMCALSVSFPMMTISRCKMIGGTRNLINQVKKNMPVYRMIKGIRRGNDTFLFPNGNKYVGSYKGELMHGKGEFIWTNGNKYTGEFKNGMRHGKGIMSYYNGYTYTGDFQKGYCEGNGRFNFKNGDVFEGNFKKGIKEGKGTYTHSNGDKYIGEWKNDKREGRGTYTYHDGGKYVGEWKNDNKEGKGTMYKSDNSIDKKGIWKGDVFQK